MRSVHVLAVDPKAAEGEHRKVIFLVRFNGIMRLTSEWLVLGSLFCMKGVALHVARRGESTKIDKGGGRSSSLLSELGISFLANR